MWAFIRKHVKKLKYGKCVMNFSVFPSGKGNRRGYDYLAHTKAREGELRLRACANIFAKTSFPSQHRMREVS